jgi:hypothetical protein
MPAIASVVEAAENKKVFCFFSEEKKIFPLRRLPLRIG